MINPYLSIPVVIEKITQETGANDIKTFQLKFLDKKGAEEFHYICGQFCQVSVFGAGESPVGIASSPMDTGILQFTVKRYDTGAVTTALHNCQEGDQIGVRGPFGNGFPMDAIEGKNVVIIGGGFAFTTLRSFTNYILHTENRGKFGDITVVYGARSPGDLIYTYDLEEWSKRSDLGVHVTVDKGDEKWKGRVGLVPFVLQEVAPSSEDAIAIVCGPPIMIKFTIPPLLDLGFSPERIITSLEMRMKCGIGKCGRCNIGHKFVCEDGPVFTLEELQGMPKEY